MCEAARSGAIYTAGPLALLKELMAAGLELAVQVPVMGGYQTHILTLEQTLRLLVDKQAVYAELFALSKSEYSEWLSSDGMVYCSAQTKAGRRCRNPVHRGTWLQPAAWKKLHDAGGYCAVHGG